MAKAKQTKTTTPVVENSTPAIEVAPIAKAPKAAKTVKTPKAATPVVEAGATDAPVVDAPVVDEFDASVEEQSIEFLAKLQQMGSLISSLKSEFRSLEKKWSRELKAVKKLSSRRKRKAGNRAPSGFVKPTRISDELASFLGKEKGDEMARTAVTRDINAYIRTHNLQDTSNGRKINADGKLSSLLKLKADEELTYFNLQRYMSPHFQKAAAALAATATAVPVA